MWVELFLTAMGVLTVTLSALLATALLISRPGAPRADRFLAGFLLLSAVDLAGWTAALMPAAVQSLLVFRLPVGFLQMPWLLAYVLTLSEPKTDCRPHLWAGGALAAVSLLSLTPRALSMAGVDFLSRQVSIDADLAGNEAALHLQFYVYAFLIGARVFSRTEPIPDQRMRRWLKTLLAVSLSAHTLVLAKSVAAAAGAARSYAALNLAVSVNAAAVLAALLLLALLKGGVVGSTTTAPRRRASNLADEAEMARLREVMSRTQLYLDPQLSLRSLARRVGLPGREVSRLINICGGTHFFDFVNQYRTDRAAELLADPSWAGRSILEIAYEVGFNSKSSFNAAFRKHQGVTPSSIRRDPADDDALATTDFA